MFSSQTYLLIGFYYYGRDQENLLDLCDRLLDLNPEMRPTTQQIFFHPFLRDMLPTNQLVEIDVLKKCELPLLNMVMRNVECFCLFDEMAGSRGSVEEKWNENGSWIAL